MKIQWKHLPADYVNYAELERITVLSHPLIFTHSSTASISANVTNTSTEEDQHDFVDPLGATEYFDANFESHQISPLVELSAIPGNSTRKNVALDNTLEMKRPNCAVIDIDLPDFVSWQKKRQRILDSFSCNESSSNRKNDGRKNHFDKCLKRLAVLEDLSGLRKLSESSQVEFVKQVSDLRENLILLWKSEKRVETVKLAVELSRLLCTTVNGDFYPIQWVHVTDVLDLFGKLVYDRLFKLSDEDRKRQGQSPLTDNFSSDAVSYDVLEKAKNWFCKISDIKELMPRFYVESALVPSMKFLDSGSMRVNLLRLTSMTSRFPSPIFAAYGRAYISKISMYIDPINRAPHWRALNDWMQSSLPQNADITWPALEWIVQCISYGATTVDDIGPLWEYCRHTEKRSYMVSAFLNGISSRYLSNHIEEAMKIVFYDGTTAVNLAVFGEKLLLIDIPNHVRVSLFKAGWRAINGITFLSDFLKCLTVWTEVIGCFFGIEEIGAISRLLIARISVEAILDPYLQSITMVVIGMVKRGCYDRTFLPVLYEMESFHTLLNFLRDIPYASQIAHEILSAFVKANADHSVADLRFCKQMIEQCGYLVRASQLSVVQDEIDNNTRLICSVLNKVDFTRDYEKGLQLLVYARSVFGENIVLITIFVRHLISLASACTVCLRDSTKKAYFLRACIANIYISMPSIENSLELLKFVIQTTQIGLYANALAQCDALVNFGLGALEGIMEESAFCSCLQDFLAVLVSFPDSPSQPLLHVFSRVLSTVNSRQWVNLSLLAEALISCLRYLWAISQSDIPGKIGNVQTNDVLYGSAPAYLEAIDEQVESVMHRMMELVQKDDNQCNVTASTLLLEHVVDRFVVEGPICMFVKNLLKKISKSNAHERRLKGIVMNLKARSSGNKELYSLLLRIGVVE